MEQIPAVQVKDTALAAGHVEALPAARPPRYYGGMKVPHLHLGDQVYKVNSEQWTAFSGQLLKDFAKKLASAQTVSFQQLMELSSAVDSIV